MPLDVFPQDGIDPASGRFTGLLKKFQKIGIDFSGTRPRSSKLGIASSYARSAYFGSYLSRSTSVCTPSALSARAIRSAST